MHAHPQITVQHAAVMNKLHTPRNIMHKSQMVNLVIRPRLQKKCGAFSHRFPLASLQVVRETAMPHIRAQQHPRQGTRKRARAIQLQHISPAPLRLCAERSPDRQFIVEFVYRDHVRIENLDSYSTTTPYSFVNSRKTSSADDVTESNVLP